MSSHLSPVYLVAHPTSSESLTAPVDSLSPPFAVAHSPPSHMSSPTESPQSHSRSPLTNAPISSPTNMAFSNAPDGRAPEHEQLSVAFVKGGKRKRLSKVCRYQLPTRRVFSYCFRLATHAIRASADAMGQVRTRVYFHLGRADSAVFFSSLQQLVGVSRKSRSHVLTLS